MTKPFHKHKVLLDENLPARQAFPRLNELFDVKHIRDDLNSGGLSDQEVYNLAKKQNRLLATCNVKDFKQLVTSTDTTGIIGISANLPPKLVDTKLTALLTRSTEKALFGKYTALSHSEKQAA
jgi:predicted nuclease of predicted toxin-antitoxin system